MAQKIRRSEEYRRHEFWETTGAMIFFILMGIVLPLTAGYTLGGFEEYTTQFTFNSYLAFTVALLFMIMILKAREVYKRDNTRPFSYLVLHDPDQDGLITRLPFTNWVRNPIKLMVASLLFFAIFGLLSTQLGLSFFAVAPQLKQQISPVSDVIFAIEPPATAETLFFIVLEVSLLVGLLRWIQYKFQLPTGVFWLMALFLIPLIVGLSWMEYHSLVYGDDEIKSWATFVFGAVGALLTLIFGSFIVWYAWHIDNNLFYHLNKAYSSDAVVVITISVLSVLAMGYFIYLLFTWKKKEFVERVAP